jgi:hypothetical protein
MIRNARPTSSVKSDGIRTRMIRNAMAHNKFLTCKFLCLKSTEELICFCHPDDRAKFEIELGLKKTNKLL